MPVNPRRALAVTVLLVIIATTGSACTSSAGSVATPGTVMASDPSSLQGWKDGAWRNWDPRTWVREAGDFFNPVIEGLWSAGRMIRAAGSRKTVDASTASKGISDPDPVPVNAERESTPYHEKAAPIGKIFFDTPAGPAVCSGTVVRDPANPGRSNLVWTAGHCVHAGRNGGWFRNIVFVPDFNDTGAPSRVFDLSTPQGASKAMPFGTWWADWAQTSEQWIRTGAETGGAGAPFDFAVLHVKPGAGRVRSLEESIGSALRVDFDAPPAEVVGTLGVWGYPADVPFDGSLMFRCLDRASRLSVEPAQPTMFRIGCTMTGGSSGGGWIRRVAGDEVVLVSNTSIGPDPSVWLAGPRLGPEAREVYETVSRRFTGR